jgi:hypothetical protein
METTSKTTHGKATMYYRGSCGNIMKMEVRSVDVTIAPFAQYATAVHVAFVPKGASKPRSFTQTYQPNLVILDGHGHPDAATLWDLSTMRHAGTITTQRGRYMNCDPRWASDFSALLAAHVEQTGARIVADFRGHDSGDSFAAVA